jgi:antitoxin (DNA-binding transcriptional repressor) of toxin-antitoxin stability system
MKAVRAGQEVVLTERGRPIAVIKPLGRGRATEHRVRELETAGLLRPATQRRKPLPPWRPRPLRGVPLARTIEEERDSR